MKLVDIDRVVQQIDPFEGESEPVVGAPPHILADGDQPFAPETRRPMVHQPRQTAFQRTHRRAVIPGVRFVIRVVNRADHRYPTETPGHPADHIRCPEMSMYKIRLITSQNPPQPLNAFRQVAQVPATETRHIDAERLYRLFPVCRARKYRYHLALKAASVDILQIGIQKPFRASRPEVFDQLNDAHNLGAKSGQATLRHRRRSWALRFSRIANGNSTVPSARIKITIAQRVGAKAGNKL